MAKANLFETRIVVAWFHNATDTHVRTVIANVAIDVPPGGNLELPKKYAWVIAARGLRLTEGKHPDENAPLAKMTKYTPPKQVLPRGVELGEIKKRAQEENEDEDGDGPELTGDDDGEEDTIGDAAEKLAAAGVDTSQLPGARRKARKDQPRGVF